MNTCYLFSGQLRDFRRIYTSIKQNILDPLNTDVIASLWINVGDEDSRFQDEGTIEEFLELYKPVYYEIQDYDFVRKSIKESSRILYQNKRSEITPEWVLSSWYKIYMANRLRHDYEFYIKNNIGYYDYIIKGRSEVEFKRPLNEKDLELAKHGIVIPRGHDSLGVNDVFWIANDENYNIAADLMLYYHDYFNSGLEFHPEKYFKYHLERFEVPIIRNDFPLILRGKEITLL